ncbi:MAG: hypothetical protein AB7U45_12065 [Desulfamplus sp.]
MSASVPHVLALRNITLIAKIVKPCRKCLCASMTDGLALRYDID